MTTGWVNADQNDLNVSVRLGADEQGRVIVNGLLLAGPEITTDTLRRVYPVRILSRILNGETAPRSPLGRPAGDNAFYGDVAASYRSACNESDRPAMLLAEENDVPVQTVRRWIREARRLGYLAPGRQGRAQP